jgi:hypothetical protein
MCIAYSRLFRITDEGSHSVTLRKPCPSLHVLSFISMFSRQCAFNGTLWCFHRMFVLPRLRLQPNSISLEDSAFVAIYSKKVLKSPFKVLDIFAWC